MRLVCVSQPAKCTTLGRAAGYYCFQLEIVRGVVLVCFQKQGQRTLIVVTPRGMVTVEKKQKANKGLLGG